MKYLYQAFFEEEKEGGYTVTFPDVPEAVTCGDTLEEAVEMAKECLGLCLEQRKEDNIEIPKSNIGAIKCPKNQFVMIIEFDSVEYNKKYNKKSVRKNVTIPVWLNDVAEANNINFSNVLQNALVKILDI